MTEKSPERLQKEIDHLQWALDEILQQNDKLSTELKEYKDLVGLNAGTRESVRRQEFIARVLVYLTLFNVILMFVFAVIVATR